MESSLMMIVHSVVLSTILYVSLVYGLKQSRIKSMDRSVLFGSFTLMYMVLFGHRLPTRINPNIL